MDLILSFLCKHNFRKCTSQFGPSVLTIETYNWNFHFKSYSGIFTWNVRAECATSEAKVDLNAETLFLIKIHIKTSTLWTCILLFHKVVPLQWLIFPNLILLITLLRNWKNVIKRWVNQTVSSWLGPCKDLFQRLFFYDVLNEERPASHYEIRSFCHVSNKIQEKNYALLIGWKQVHFLM